MSLFAQGSGGRFDVLLADPLHDAFDVLLDGGLLAHQDRVQVVSLHLPLPVQSVPSLVREHAKDRPEKRF